MTDAYGNLSCVERDAPYAMISADTIATTPASKIKSIINAPNDMSATPICTTRSLLLVSASARAAPTRDAAHKINDNCTHEVAMRVTGVSPNAMLATANAPTTLATSKLDKNKDLARLGTIEPAMKDIENSINDATVPHSNPVPNNIFRVNPILDADTQETAMRSDAMRSANGGTVIGIRLLARMPATVHRPTPTTNAAKLPCMRSPDTMYDKIMNPQMIGIKK